MNPDDILVKYKAICSKVQDEQKKVLDGENSVLQRMKDLDEVRRALTAVQCACQHLKAREFIHQMAYTYKKTGFGKPGAPPHRPFGDGAPPPHGASVRP